MTRLIDCSIPDVVACEISQGFTGKLKFRLAYGWNAHEFTQDQIASASLIDEDKYRSGGGAAAGAIIGGVLTGGIGLLAGAALGGRRRNRAAFVVLFDNGHHVAFEETKNAIVKSLLQIVQGQKARALVSQANPMPVIEATAAQTPDQLAAPDTPDAPDLTDRPPVLEKKRPPYGAIVFWLVVALVGIATWRAVKQEDPDMALFAALLAIIPVLAIGLIALLIGKAIAALRRK